jgi:CheY-like chemotaxis protein
MVPLILMIENDEDDRFLTKENFQKDWPAAVLEFVSGNDLPHRLRAGRRPQMILMSMNVRPYDGLQLIRQIRQEKGYGATPIVVLSETALPGEISASYAAGASSFIQKPASYEDALFKIKAFIDYWGHTAELPVLAE